MSEPIVSDLWITAKEVRRILACGDEAIIALVDAGRLGKRKLPNARPRYSRADVSRILAESVKPAS